MSDLDNQTSLSLLDRFLSGEVYRLLRNGQSLLIAEGALQHHSRLFILSRSPGLKAVVSSSIVRCLFTSLKDFLEVGTLYKVV